MVANEDEMWFGEERRVCEYHKHYEIQMNSRILSLCLNDFIVFCSPFPTLPIISQKTLVLFPLKALSAGPLDIF